MYFYKSCEKKASKTIRFSYIKQLQGGAGEENVKVLALVEVEVSLCPCNLVDWTIFSPHIMWKQAEWFGVPPCLSWCTPGQCARMPACLRVCEWLCAHVRARAQASLRQTARLPACLG